MKIQGAIFDMDGTLLDSMPMWDRLCVDYLRGRGLPPRADLMEQVRHRDLPGTAAYLQETYAIPATAETVLAEILEAAGRQYRECVPLKPGAAALLQALHDAGVPLCVATASDRTLADAALAHNGVRHLFVDVVSCSDVGQGKRSPLVFERAREILGTERAQTAVFEDSLYAAQTAHRAGFLLVGVRDDFEPQQEALRTLSDVYLPDFADAATLFG